MASTLSPFVARRSLLAFLVATGVLVAVGAAVLASVRALVGATRWVEHTHEVIAAAESLLVDTRTVEAAARGYRLSGREDMRAEYVIAVPAARKDADRLIALTADNPTQHRRAREIERLMQARLAEVETLVRMQQRDGLQAARNAFQTSPGFEQMRRLTAAVDELLLAERALLRARRDDSERLATLVTAAVVAGIGLPLVLLGLLVRGLAQENRRALSLEREARNAVIGLERSLVERDRLSEQRRRLGGYAGMLQSCQSLQEALGITGQLIADLLPDVSGRCYVLRASQNLAESAASFGVFPGGTDELLHPNDCWGLRRGQPHRAGVGDGHIVCPHVHGELGEDGWTLCLPLIAQNVPLGLLHLRGRGEANLAEDRETIEAIAEQLSLAMVNLQLRDTLRIQSLRDPLTGLYNRRYLEESLQRELQRCERREQPLSVVILDVDHFKAFNDSHGHAAGDALLARLGQLLEQQVRGEDIACRYGGEEFVLVLPETDADTARARAEQIRLAIGATTVTHMRQHLGPATASIGVATSPDDGRTPATLIESADAALYRAKTAGRNRVTLASD